MRVLGSMLACAAVIAAVAGAAPAAEAPSRTKPAELAGWSRYDKLCLPCHGDAGKGDGPATPWLWPRPRDLTKGEWRWSSTPVGDGALDADLADTIRWGTGAMPAFGDALDDATIASLVEVVRAFAPASTQGHAGAVPAQLDGDAARGETLWKQACASCHPKQLDLTTEPLRRPRDPGEDVRASLYRSIAWGLTGTAMPSFGSLGDTQVLDVVAYVDSIRFRGAATFALPERVISHDGGVHGGFSIDPQGEPPETLAPAQASLSSKRCGRCHASQYETWKDSIHGFAASPGLLGQLARIDDDEDRTSCRRCHAPLAEQADDDQLLAEGITCAACHLRGWTRNGPVTIDAKLDPLPDYPTRGLAVYERSDFCMPCHELPARNAVEGRPLLDTYREWLAGPYMPRGVQCQHCHMPERAHTWKGIHDKDTFRQGIRVEAIAARGKTGVVSVRARLWNEGAGHMLPTTPTPAAWLEIQLVDADGDRIKGAHASLRIGRNLTSKHDEWVELEDTRVPPGESIELAKAWKRGRVAEATHAKITVRVAPDEYYERLYAARLDGDLTAAVRKQFQAALKRAKADRYVAEELLVEIE